MLLSQFSCTSLTIIASHRIHNDLAIEFHDALFTLASLRNNSLRRGAHSFEQYRISFHILTGTRPCIFCLSFSSIESDSVETSGSHAGDMFCLVSGGYSGWVYVSAGE
jgi:hypothetical protein